MISKKLTEEHREEFYSFLEKQKILNLKKNRPWFIDHGLNSTREVEFNTDKRQLFGTFKEHKLVGVMACRLWTTMPYTTFDTFVIDKTLGYKETKNVITPMKITALEWAEDNGRVVHLYIGPLRESRLMISKKGLWQHALKNMHYIPSEIGIIPADNDIEHRFIRAMMEWKTYPVDMLVFMLTKDINHLPENWDHLITLK